MRIKLGSVAFLEAAGSGYGLGLDDRGHLVEFLGDWPALAELQSALHGPEAVYLEVDDGQVVAVDDELRMPLGHGVMAERARFLRSELGPR